MPKAINLSTMFGDSIPIIGKFRTDDERVPLFNPEDSGVSYLPGEPVLLQRGENQYGYMCQDVIHPGQTGYVVRRFTADFPCDLSAEVEEGTPIYWDPTDTAGSDVGTAKLEGDVADGWLLGWASHSYNGHETPELGANDEVVCGTTTSTRIRVVSVDGPTPGVGDYEYGAS